MLEQVRYVTARPSLADPKRWYWQRPGFDLKRLSNDPIQRFEEATRLNSMADAKETSLIGTVGFVVDGYQQSEKYGELKPGTLKYYKRFCADFRALGPSEPWAAVSRRVVVDFVHSYPKSMRRQCAGVVSNIFNHAMYLGYCKENLAKELGLPATKARSLVWDQDQSEAWLKACMEDEYWRPMRMVFQGLRFGCQRVMDTVDMDLSQYNGERIELTQQKTGLLVEVPCHKEWQAEIEAERERKRGDKFSTTKIAQYVGPKGSMELKYTRFTELFNRIKERAGLSPDLQARDLRRTAAVMLHMAGAEYQDIASIGGWSQKNARNIVLDHHYLVKTYDQAKAGIRKWEEMSNKR